MMGFPGWRHQHILASHHGISPRIQVFGIEHYTIPPMLRFFPICRAIGEIKPGLNAGFLERATAGIPVQESTVLY
jgi:hypothetical protein